MPHREHSMIAVELLLLYRKTLAVYSKYLTGDMTLGYLAFYRFAILDLRMRTRHCLCFSFVSRGSVSVGRY